VFISFVIALKLTPSREEFSTLLARDKDFSVALSAPKYGR